MEDIDFTLNLGPCLLLKTFGTTSVLEYHNIETRVAKQSRTFVVAFFVLQPCSALVSYNSKSRTCEYHNFSGRRDILAAPQNKSIKRYLFTPF